MTSNIGADVISRQVQIGFNWRDQSEQQEAREYRTCATSCSTTAARSGQHQPPNSVIVFKLSQEEISRSSRLKWPGE